MCHTLAEPHLDGRGFDRLVLMASLFDTNEINSTFYRIPEPRMAEIKANLSGTWFAWSGPTTNGMPAYYRIQGPTVVIEYAPQPLGGDPTMHIHTIYRDPTNDYGKKSMGH